MNWHHFLGLERLCVLPGWLAGMHWPGRKDLQVLEHLGESGNAEGRDMLQVVVLPGEGIRLDSCLVAIQVDPMGNYLVEQLH